MNWSAASFIVSVIILVVFLATSFKYGDITPAPSASRNPTTSPPVNKPIKRSFQRGDRVRATSQAGFHRGATGIVEFQEPNQERCWVLRDGAGSPVWYHSYELELV
jgi:hypothetical protein